MNWVDFVIIVVLIYFALEGIGKSLILEIIDFFSFALALVLSLRFYNLATIQFEKYFQIPHSLANVLGFITIWFLAETILFTLARILLTHFKKIIPASADRLLGVIPATLRGVVFIAIFLVLIATFPIQPRIKKNVTDSKIGSYILSKTYQLEAPLKGVFGGITLDTLTFLTVKPKTNQSVDIGFKNNKFFYDEKAEFAMIELVNNERVSNGFKPLSPDAKLRLVARNHSADMFNKGYFSHYSEKGESVADRAQEEGMDFLVIGENLAYAPNLQLAHQGLMGSPGHKANIISSDFDKIGIGIANGDEFGIMFTQVFTN